MLKKDAILQLIMILLIIGSITFTFYKYVIQDNFEIIESTETE